jgi:aminoglycoside N3'-acetyltransferase
MLVAGHEDCPTPFGPGSPFVKMIDANMHLLCFGVDTHVFTLYHTFEDLSGDRFPHRVYLDRTFDVRCIDRNGRERVVKTPVHDPDVSKTRIDSNPCKEKQIRALLTEAGVLDRVRVGKGTIYRVRAKDLMSELDRWLERGITIYG